jgi:8-oxo-dGTP diphosphatase
MAARGKRDQSVGCPDWGQAPVFGTAPDANLRVIRPSAYGLIHDDRGRLAVARDPNGFYLPGGGIEAGESPAETIVRESLEECGLVVRLGNCVVHAVQFVDAQAEQTHFEKRSVFIAGRCDSVATLPAEPGYELRWLDVDTAVQVLSHESHRWAVHQWTMDRQ